MAKYKKSKKTTQSLSRMIIGTVLLIGVGGCSLYTIEKYNNPSLYGKWISTETHEEIIFNEEGTVTVSEAIYMPEFDLTAPNKMLYTIEDKTFEMYYELDGRSLYWGISKDYMEEFKRK